MVRGCATGCVCGWVAGGCTTGSTGCTTPGSTGPGAGPTGATPLSTGACVGTSTGTSGNVESVAVTASFMTGGSVFASSVRLAAENTTCQASVWLTLVLSGSIARPLVVSSPASSGARSA